MSKMKVYELAKELGKSSKELLEFLSGKNIEVKSHMSSIEDKEIALARNAFGGKHEGTETEKPAGLRRAPSRCRMQNRCRYRTEGLHLEAGRYRVRSWICRRNSRSAL